MKHSESAWVMGEKQQTQRGATTGAYLAVTAGIISVMLLAALIYWGVTYSTAISVVSPNFLQTISGNFTLKASVSSTFQFASGQFLVDGTPVGTTITGVPYTYVLNTTTYSNYWHTFDFKATDTNGKTVYSYPVFARVNNANPPTTVPSISITAPASGATIAHSVTLSVTAQDQNGTITNVHFAVGAFTASFSSAPYSTALDTTTLANGTYTFTATATDSGGKTAQATEQLIVSNATTSNPQVSFTSPAPNSVVTGTVTISANATDTGGTITQVSFIDPTSLGTDTVAPYQVSWDTTTVANGSYTITATATDSTGRMAVATLPLTVNNPSNPQVTFTSPAPNAVLTGTATLSATATDNQNGTITQVAFSDPAAIATDTSSPYSVNWDTTKVTNGSYTLTATATDTTARTAQATVNVTVNNPSNPQISWTAPASGSTLSGTVTLSVNATDVNATITQVAFTDPTSIGTDTSSPYSISWDTTTVPNGTYTLTATATDSTSKTVSATLSVTVNNASNPQVSFTSPSPGATLTGTATLSVNATDTNGTITSVTWTDPSTIGSDTTSPYSISWDTTSVPNGAYTITATAKDSTNKTVVATVNVTVSNSGSSPPPPQNGDQITVTDTSGFIQANRPITIGRPFVQGEITGYPQAQISGTALVTQADVKNRWPDGSVKFAVVSFVIPSISANGSVTVGFANQSAGNNTGYQTQAQMLASGYNFDGQIKVVGTKSTNVSARAILTAATSCNDPGADPDGGKYLCTYWLKGPIVTAVILEDRANRTYDFNTDNATGNPLHPMFEVWFYPGNNKVYVGYSLENDWASTTSNNGMRDQTYSVTLTAGNTSPVTEYTNGSFNHITRTRWHKSYWISAPPTVHIDNSYAYLSQTKVYPHWDPSLAVASSKITSEVTGFSSTPQTLSGTTGANGQIGYYPENLNATGAAEWHGPLTTWDIIYLLTQDDGMKNVMLSNADLGGRIPYFYREADAHAGRGQFFDASGTIPTQGRVISINARQQVTLSDTTYEGCANNFAADYINIGGPNGQDTDNWALDSSHWPNLAYASYMTTGAYAYYEEQLMQSAYAIAFNNGCIQSNLNYIRQGSAGYWYTSQERGTDWAARDNAIGAAFAVDGSPEQAYFQDKLYNNIAAREGRYGLTNDVPGSRTTAWTYGNTTLSQSGGASPIGIYDSGLTDYVSEGNLNTSGSNSPQSADANFQAAYTAYIWGFINDLGFNTTELITFGQKRYIHLSQDSAVNKYHLSDYVFPTLTNSGSWIATYAATEAFYASQPSAWPSCASISLDESYGHEGLAALSYGSTLGLTDGGFSAATGYTTIRGQIGCLTGTNSFQDTSPKWDITPRSGGGSPPNPLTVAITVPANGATVTLPTGITATATDTTYSVTNVQFFVDAVSIGTDTSGPYSVTWSSGSVGTHTLTAVGTDSAGNTSTSSITVTVGATQNPTVAFTSPANGATVSGSVTLAVNVTNTVSVSYVANTTSLGTVNSSPFSLVWDTTTIANGTYTVVATATSSSSTTATASITLTVNNTSGGGGGTVGWTKLTGTMLKGGSENATPCPPDNTYSGGNPPGFASQCQYVIESWNSAVIDSNRNRLVIWGGGHADYAGNEVYAINLSNNPPNLIRLNPPSPPNTTTNCVETLSDGRPNSRHTYDGLIYFPSQDTMLAAGGALNYCGFPTSGSWVLNVSSVLSSCAPNCSSAWTQVTGTLPDAEVGITSGYDPNTGLGFVLTQDELLSFNPATNKFTLLNGNVSLGYHGTAVIDPNNKLLIHVDSGSGIHAFSIASGSSYAETTPTTSGCATLISSSVNGNGGYPGLAYDPIAKVVVGYPNGGNTLYILNTSNWTCTTETYSTAPQSDPTTEGSGTFKHFSYLSSLDEFVLCNDPYNDCWVLHRQR